MAHEVTEVPFETAYNPESLANVVVSGILVGSGGLEMVRLSRQRAPPHFFSAPLNRRVKPEHPCFDRCLLGALGSIVKCSCRLRGCF